MIDWIEQTTDYWRSGGILLLPIALVSFGIWGCFMRSREVLLRTIRDSDAVEHALHHGEIAGSPESMVIGLSRFSGGIAAMIRMALGDIAQGAGPFEAFSAREHESTRLLRRDFVMLVALTTVAPLLGLLGTVMGMIDTFDAVSSIGGNTGSRVAGGISRALITTQFGLVIALPGVFGLARLRRMLQQAQVRMAECRAHAVERLETYERETLA